MNKQQNFSGKWIALGKVTPTFSSDYKNALRILKISGFSSFPVQSRHFSTLIIYNKKC